MEGILDDYDLIIIKNLVELDKNIIERLDIVDVLIFLFNYRETTANKYSYNYMKKYKKFDIVTQDNRLNYKKISKFLFQKIFDIKKENEQLIKENEELRKKVTELSEKIQKLEEKSKPIEKSTSIIIDPEIERIKNKMIADGVPSHLIDKALDILKKIYIGQFIRDEGVLQSTFEENIEEIELLKKYGLIEENRWYSHHLYLTTEEGEKIGSKLVKQVIQKYKSILDILSKYKLEIPIKALRFLIFNYLLTKYSFPVYPAKDHIFDWREPILKDRRVRKLCDDILMALEKEGLCVETNMYVSTGGGHVQDLHYVIPPEVHEFLDKSFDIKTGLDEKLARIIRVYTFLRDIDDILLYEDDLNQVRWLFWDKLKMYELLEDEIQPIIDSMSKKGITSQYNGLLSDKKPFIIKNVTSYKIFLDKKLLEPLIKDLLEIEESKFPQIEKRKTISSKQLTKIKEILPISTEDLIELFIEIVTLEIKLRSLIKEKLKEKYGDGWWNKIPSNVRKNCESRREKDIKDGWPPEEDLLNYADFSDYERIIEHHWDLFKDYFRNDQLRLKTYLKDINNLGRKRVMHIRTIIPDFVPTVRLKIRWLSESIDKKLKGMSTYDKS